MAKVRASQADSGRHGRGFKLLHPEWYHGDGVQPPFFEGWYYKMVSADGRERLAVIPGLYRSRDAAESHAFIQVLDGRHGRSWYHRYPLEEFHADRRAFDVQIGANRFTCRSLQLDLHSDSGRLSGRITHAQIRPWPVAWRSPGVMGWYAWVPFMQCYHGILSMDHELNGTLQLETALLDFNGGRGYLEKDWGSSFPHAYVWMQSNHFEQPGTSLFASVAIIPWLRGAFVGFIAGFLHQGHLYRFATYLNGEIEQLELPENRISCILAGRSHRLDLQARLCRTGQLQAPGAAGMNLRIGESLDGTVAVTLSERKSGRVLFAQTGQHSGVEASGDLPRLLRMVHGSP